MKKRIVALLLLGCMALPLLSGCKKTPEEPDIPADVPPAENPQEAPPAEEPAELEVMLPLTEYEDLSRHAYPESIPEATLVPVGLGEAGYFEARLASGDLPDICVVERNEAFFSAVERGLLADLSGTSAAEKLYEPYRAAYTYDGALYGVPLTTEFYFLYANRTILAQAGWPTAIPSHWDNFVVCCEDIQMKTGLWPLAIVEDEKTPASLPLDALLANTVIPSLGAEEYERQVLDGSFDYAAYPELTERVDALAWYRLPGNVQDEDAVAARLAAGDVAMALGGSWSAEAFEEALGGELLVVLPPFQSNGASPWAVSSPGKAFAVASREDDTLPAEACTVFEWLIEWLPNGPLTYLLKEQEGLPVPIADRDGVPAWLPLVFQRQLRTTLLPAPFAEPGDRLRSAAFEAEALPLLHDVWTRAVEAPEALPALTTALAANPKNG